MNTNGILTRHWLHVFTHFAIDAIMFFLAFFVGIVLRFQDEWNMLLNALWDYWFWIFIGSVVFSCVAYIFGLYSAQSGKQNIFRRSVLVGFCLVISIGVMVALFYINFSTRIGRGAMFAGSAVAYFSILAHHGLLLRWLQNYRERVIFIVSCPFDEMEIRLNQKLWGKRLNVIGLVYQDGYEPTGEIRVLGRIHELPAIVDRFEIQRVLCTNKSMNEPGLYLLFCQLRYSGVVVVPLISLFEEVYQTVPLELVTTEWLLNASGLPHMFYIKKLKRGFDIVSSIIGLICLSPALFLGVMLVKLTSRGPVLYHQVRSGRFGKTFSMFKLRTMRVDAEKHGAVWAVANDPRTTPVGGFLRKYRVDEIPQLVNVLRGEMSLVGPRPERPEFVEQLSERISFYRERLMIQPGITGWAQVSYPYGANIEDTRRKLEYDLYYMKHMSFFLDLFILLDTIRIILVGGLRDAHKQNTPRYETSTGEDQPGASVPVGRVSLAAAPPNELA